MVADAKSLRIACRHVCTDQWLVTHVDPSWTIASLKLFLLHKFSRSASDPDHNPRAISVSPRKARRRSLSPITFATPTLRKAQPLYASAPSSGESSDTEHSGDLDLDLDDDDDVNITKSFTDAHRYKYNARPSTSSTSDSLSTARLPLPDALTSSSASYDVNAYILLTFSTTQILEDRFSLSWYGIHPGELLELHPAGVSFVSLPRSTLDAYIAPYFATRVWALRIVGHGSDEKEDESLDVRTPNLSQKREKKKVAVEWKERWAIIHQGVFSLCKERHDTHAAFSSPLSSMLSIRDSAHFKIPLHTSRIPGRYKSSISPASSNIVCVKFGTGRTPRQRTFSNESSVTFDQPPSGPSFTSTSISASAGPGSGGGQGSWWRRGSRDVSTTLSLGLTSSASALVGSAFVGSSSNGISEVWDSLARRGSRAGIDESEGEPGSSREKGKAKERDEAEDAVWIVLDMLGSSACSHILRILHRHAPPQCNSTFLPGRGASIYSPSPSPIIFNSRPSTPGSPTTPGPTSFNFPPSSSQLHSQRLSQAPLLSPTALDTSAPYFPYKSYHFGQGSSSDSRPDTPIVPLPGYTLPDLTIGYSEGVPYPFWRLELVRDARRAGLGAVGRAMELVMFGEDDEDDDDYADDEAAEEEDDLAIAWARRGTTSSLEISSVVEQPSPVDTDVQPRGMTGRHGSNPSVPSDATLPEGRALQSDADPPSDHVGPQLEIESPASPASAPDPAPTTRPHRASHPLVDLTSLHEAEPPVSESDSSEAEWDGWVDAVVAQYRRESLARRAQARREALAASASVPVSASTSAAPWVEGWTSQYGGGESSTNVASPDRENADYSELGTWSWPGQNQRGSDAEGSAEGSSHSQHSSDPQAPPSAYTARRTTSGEMRGRGHGRSGSAGRTLSTYSSVDSSLRRTVTMRTNLNSISLNQLNRSSMQAAFSSASSSDVNLAQDSVEVRRSGSASPPPPHARLSRPSIASFRSASNVNVRNHVMSPLSTQIPDEDPSAGVDYVEPDVDDIEEVGNNEDVYENELGHGQVAGPHPVPLPGMRMAPSGYTTFRHNALYGGQANEKKKGGKERAQVHAGVVHGQSVGRLPMGMGSMVNTVSSTVSVGPSARRSGRRF
ncbi:hypothetical protein BD311DRAFT_484962 [Dichomitus squalens]|uniref:Uncharacterized protein n=1 Tax=Dichomitus squalens TaxID=114155 RepID=A0A4Q9MEL1_9APHY|nr:hypothetical protein BD311DRAFT_484962 [Dichomitus squalens]